MGGFAREARSKAHRGRRSGSQHGLRGKVLPVPGPHPPPSRAPSFLPPLASPLQTAPSFWPPTSAARAPCPPPSPRLSGLGPQPAGGPVPALQPACLTVTLSAAACQPPSMATPALQVWVLAEALCSDPVCPPGPASLARLHTHQPGDLRPVPVSQCGTAQHMRRTHAVMTALPSHQRAEALLAPPLPEPRPRPGPLNVHPFCVSSGPCPTGSLSSAHKEP